MAAPRGLELRCEVEKGPGAVVIRFDGEVGLGSGRRVDRRLDRLPLEGASEVVVDLRRATFIDSTGLRVLLELLSRSRREGFALRVLPGNGQVRRAIELSGLHSQIELADEQDN